MDEGEQLQKQLLRRTFLSQSSFFVCWQNYKTEKRELDANFERQKATSGVVKTSVRELGLIANEQGDAIDGGKIARVFFCT